MDEGSLSFNDYVTAFKNGSNSTNSNRVGPNMQSFYEWFNFKL